MRSGAALGLGLLLLVAGCGRSAPVEAPEDDTCVSGDTPCFCFKFHEWQPCERLALAQTSPRAAVDALRAGCAEQDLGDCYDMDSAPGPGGLALEDLLAAAHCAGPGSPSPALEACMADLDAAHERYRRYLRETNKDGLDEFVTRPTPPGPPAPPSGDAAADPHDVRICIAKVGAWKRQCAGGETAGCACLDDPGQAACGVPEGCDVAEVLRVGEVSYFLRRVPPPLTSGSPGDGERAGSATPPAAPAGNGPVTDEQLERTQRERRCTIYVKLTRSSCKRGDAKACSCLKDPDQEACRKPEGCDVSAD